jgi:hypothetical protein
MPMQATDVDPAAANRVGGVDWDGSSTDGKTREFRTLRCARGQHMPSTRVVGL